MRETPGAETRRDPRDELRRPKYKPISDYGIIGDMRTAALVGLAGSLDWCCVPRFDSASLFAAILDHE